MDLHTRGVARDLGIDEQEAIHRLERPGSNMLHGIVRGERGPLYYSVFTERSDVSITTAAVGAPGPTPLTDLSGVRGYRIFIAPSHRGVLLHSGDQNLAQKLHELTIGEARLGGPTHALSQAIRTAKELGVEASYCGLAG